MVIFIFVDIIWLIFCSSSHNNNNKYEEEIVQNYWDSLSLLHGVIFILAILELIIKGVICYLCFMVFKEKGEVKNLINFTYDNLD